MITMKPERRMPPSHPRTSTGRRTGRLRRGAREGGAVVSATAPPISCRCGAVRLEKTVLRGVPREGRTPGEFRRVAQLLLDAQKLIVFRDALAAGGRAALDLTRVHRDDEVGDRGVLGLARAVREHRRVAGAVRHVD